MKKIFLLSVSILMLSSCLTIEKVEDSGNIKDTTIIKVNDGNNDKTKTLDSETVKVTKEEISNLLKNKTNVEILKDSESIKKVFNRNEREYNLNLKGVWVASVANLDFPKNPTTNVETLKKEYIKLVDNIKSFGLNAIFMQIKPGTDALYKTTYWPTSRYLTGQEGLDLSDDLLPFMISEAHKRGIEFHAWINPYRVSTSDDFSKISDKSIVKLHPEWVFKYGNKLFLNPGNPDVVDYVSRSIEDIVMKYDIDGIHLDDYFYPYPIKGEIIDDSKEFQLYGKNFSNIDEWRRNNVNEMIKNLSVSVHKINPKLVFGVSPFGIWRNKSSDINGSNTNGLQSYDDLYADSIKWMEKGWVDYVAPQIYWNIGKKGADYETLVKWWEKESIRTNTPLYVGHGVYKYNENEIDHWTNKFEMQDQIKINKTLKGVKGSILFRYETLLEHPEIIDQFE